MPTISSVGPVAVDPNSAITGDGTVCHPLGLSIDESVVYIPFNSSNFTADQGGTWVVSDRTIYTNLYYKRGLQVTISVIIGFSQINPPNTVKTVRMRLPAEVANVLHQGPFSGFPDNATGFVGSAIVTTNIDALALNGIPAYCVVSGGPIDNPSFGNLAIAIDQGLFPASPSNGFVILATCTYILQE